jgi:signal transduction histidine kinase/ligand-binding sensor domain-containing protein
MMPKELIADALACDSLWDLSDASSRDYRKMIQRMARNPSARVKLFGKHGFVLALFFANVASHFAQPAPQTPEAVSDFVVREWHFEDGLPQEDVFQLFQDSSGFLWVAGRGTLSRFDGGAFQTYPAPETQQTFYGIAEDLDGSLLFTPRSGDPVRFRNGVFAKEPLPVPYAGRSIGYFTLAPDGARWFSLKGGVLRLDGKTSEFFEEKDGITDEGWARFASDGAKQFWVCTDGRLFRYEKGRLIGVTVPAGVTELRVASSKKGGPWVITPTHVLKLGENDRLDEVSEIPPLIGPRYINAAFEDAHGDLWLGTRSLGIYVISRGKCSHVQTASETIQALIQDRDGTVWAGANTGGLSAIAPKIYTLYNKLSGLTTIAALAVCEDLEGAIWVANGDGGVARIRGTKIDKWVINHDGRLYGARSVSPHPEGGVWVVGGSSLFRIRGDSDRVEPEPSVSEGLHPILFTAKNGDFWMTTTDRRVARLRNGRYEYFGKENGVPLVGVRSFCEIDSGVILTGTNDGRLAKFDGSRFVPLFSPDLHVESPINVIVPLEDAFLLATASEGLVIFSASGIGRINSSAGLPNDNVTQVVPDGRGNVWCGSGKGVFRVSVSDLPKVARGEARSVPSIRLGRDEGLRAITCVGIYGPGATRSRDGRIWFASRQGVLAIDPNAEAFSPRPPVVAVEHVRADHGQQGGLKSNVIHAGTRKLEIHYSVLCLATPSRVRTRHRLVGFDSEWVDSGPGRVVTYLQIPPGKYRFEVATGFGDPAVEESRATVDIEVPRHWWQMPWFSAAVLIGAVGVIVLLARAWSHRRLRLKIDKLERENAVALERARIARNIHDDVGASLTRISLLTQASSSRSPDASQLDRIYETAAEITRSLDEIVWAIDPQDDTLESFVSYLTDFSQKFLDLAKVRCRLHIPAALPPTVLSSEVRHDLFLCCRELLNNVVKHAAATEVILRLDFDPPDLRIVIEDDGRGITADNHSQSSPDRVSTGHGVKNVSERIQRIGGTLILETPSTGGTRVALSVKIS